MRSEPDMIDPTAAILGDVMDDHGVTLKQLARATGRDISTICRYRSGEATTPTFVLATLFGLTLDRRLPDICTGDRVAYYVLRGGGEQIVPLPELMQRTIAGVRAMADCATRMEAITRDQRIDAADAAHIRTLEKLCHQTLGELPLLLASVHHYRNNGATK